MRTPIKINPNDTPAARAKNRQDWIDIAGRVLKHEFADADSSTVESLLIGLQAYDTPECRRAVKMLKERKGKSK